MRLRKSQSIFDFALALIAVSGLIVGIVRIWIWFNANYAKRQQAYQQGRLSAAGHSRPSSYTTPIQIGYEPLSLTPDWVFMGTPSGTVTGVPVGNASTGPGSFCDTNCTSQCTGQLGCQSPTGEFNTMCSCYQSCSAQCYCNIQITNTVNSYAGQVTSICGPDNDCSRCVYSECDSPAGCGQACSLHKNADSMRDQASKCDDPWDLCWWGDWGKTPSELRQAATELDQNAAFLEASANKLSQRGQELKGCCAEPTKAEQQACLDQVSLETSCDASCSQESQNIYSQCDKGCGSSSCLQGCKSQTDAYFNTCYTPCLNSKSVPCNEKTDNMASLLQTQIDSAQQNQATLQASLNDINTALSGCASSADATCALQCRVYDASGIYYSIDTACYNSCYGPARNSCCQQYSGWGRSCDTPTTNCDTGGSPANPPAKCGLSKLTGDLNTELQTVTDQISKWQQAIATLASCCSLGAEEDQNNCINSKL